MKKPIHKRSLFILFCLVIAAACYLLSPRSSSTSLLKKTNYETPPHQSLNSTSKADSLVSNIENLMTNFPEATNTEVAATTETNMRNCYNHLSSQISSDKTYADAFKKQLSDALALAHLVYPTREEIQLDRNLALKLLNEVHAEDPENSAPLAFIAIIFHELNRPDLATKNLNLIRDSTNHYNSYWLNINRTIFGLVKTPTDYLLAAEVVFTRPNLDMKKLMELITTYNCTYLAEQMMVDALNSENVFSGIDWDPIDYATGCGSLKKINPKNNCLKLNEIAEYKIKTKGLESLYPSSLEKNCDIKEFESAVAAVKKVLAKFE